MGVLHIMFEKKFNHGRTQKWIIQTLKTLYKQQWLAHVPWAFRLNSFFTWGKKERLLVSLHHVSRTKDVLFTCLLSWRLKQSKWRQKHVGKYLRKIEFTYTYQRENGAEETLVVNLSSQDSLTGWSDTFQYSRPRFLRCSFFYRGTTKYRFKAV